jgi:Carboxypeptidase regulatory-like domain/TonB-dependent Receptor Plug Domain
MRFRIARMVVLAAALVAAAAAPSAAQIATGRIDATVTDSTGAVLPGASVDISGPQIQTAVTDAKGEAHFLNLAPGTYTVGAKLSGFSDYLNKGVQVAAGGSAPLKIALSIAGVNTQVTVTSESPVLDTKKTSTSTNVTLDELQNVPSARDPWVVLQTVPGVVADRVNVGGAESGQQSNYQAKGAASGENTWNMDGVAITDMAALGSSPTYYDFDMFQEMQVTTGGADLKSATPGVQLNMVLKSGSNTPHGSTRGYLETPGMQANNMPDDLKTTLGKATGGKGNRTAQYADYGFEVGGPLLKDHLWGWGSIGKTDVRLVTLANTPDKTLLKDYSFKGSGQFNNSIRGNFTYFRGAKLKYGRSASPTRPPETTVDQGGPTEVYKGEGNFVVGNSLFLSGNVSHVKGGFFLTPEGGLDKQMYKDDANVWHGTYYNYVTKRPQNAVVADGNLFKGRHELKFGFGWRRADVDSSSTVPGNHIVSYFDTYPNMIAEVTAWGHITSTRGLYENVYAGDTMTFDRLTLNAGVRWDKQSSSVKELAQAGNPLLPTLLPDITGQPANDAVVWKTVTPRIGATYALTESRKTIARASYAMFASQLNATAGSFLSVVQYRGVYFYDVTDKNGNKVVDPSELAGLDYGNWYGFDPSNPANVSTPIHKVGSYKTPMTYETQVGLDHELMTNFGISGTFTYRYFNHFTWRNNGLRASDYEQVGTYADSRDPVGTFSIPLYGVIASHVPANRAATTYQERPGYHQRYVGFELAATKRMSNRWMARFGFSTNDHNEYFAGPQSITDPTPTISTTTANPNVNGGDVLRPSSGSGKSSIYQVLPKFQYIASGLYQAPWGINLGANLVVVQGFSEPYFRSQVNVTDPIARQKTVLVTDVSKFRLPTVSNLSARIGKQFTVANRARLNLDLDIFNVLNSATVLGRQYDIRATTFNQVQEIMNPRILRVGLRFNF